MTSTMDFPKAEVKLRTSITMSPDVLETLRGVCNADGVSVSSFIEKAVCSTDVVSKAVTHWPRTEVREAAARTVLPKVPGVSAQRAADIASKFDSDELAMTFGLFMKKQGFINLKQFCLEDLHLDSHCGNVNTWLRAWCASSSRAPSLLRFGNSKTDTNNEWVLQDGTYVPKKTPVFDMEAVIQSFMTDDDTSVNTLKLKVELAQVEERAAKLKLRIHCIERGHDDPGP